ncbi:SRPBCC family protein [Thalassorhabdomicrobium marinisediminis]|uniref:SRPBCC family protein n=1 Tax=Thalassorhabdomicrobium marinisediminis TaxID=2170577 RepID=UPI00249158CA|nr:SRPBCC family protein [Thalassorhabdomicrobium marinisediminis]
MDFTARSDIEAPIDHVFAQVTDFPAFERSIMRRGGDVERIQGGDAPAVGTKWRVKFRMRGKDRVVMAEIVKVDAPHGLTVDVTSPSVDGMTRVELVALSRARTRLIVSADAGAKSIPAKLMMQSIRFAKGKTEQRFKDMVATFAKDVESRYRG